MPWTVDGGKDEPSRKAQIDIGADLETLMAELSAAVGKDRDGFFTVSDAAESRGWTRDRVRQVLRKAKHAGRLESAKVFREALDGRACPTAAYRILPRKE